MNLFDYFDELPEAHAIKKKFTNCAKRPRFCKNCSFVKCRHQKFAFLTGRLHFVNV